MTRWTEEEVLAALRLVETSGHGVAPESAYEAVGTDTRTLRENTLFVALRGENFDGHEFLAAAAEKGATGAVVEEVPPGAPALRYYIVPETLGALHRLARHRRRSLNAKVVAITGTNGKTTTKEMARAILSTRFRTHATTANLNNLIGGPLTLLGAPSDAEAVVVEIGTNAPGEIARLTDTVEPDAGIVTAVAEAHLEGIGTLEGVLREKTTLLSRLRSGGVAIVADEPASLPERARSLASRVRVAGWTARADGDLRADSLRIDEEGRVRFTWDGRDVALPFGGKAHARNALLALALGLEWGVDPDEAVAALGAMPAPKMRGEVHRYGELAVIADCYNANPASLAAAVDTLAAMPRRGGRVAVVGSMLELGPDSRALHEKSARLMAEAELDLVVATGLFQEAFGPLKGELGDRLILAEDVEAAWPPLSARLRGEEVVLLKGSRGVALERLLPRMEEQFGESADRNGG